ncbi:tissue factor pathway inhibitor isoform X1 [Lingula anatina]|uniref:Tissue factor pathway inhibitor isoform X1 n=1 Tax=Lingula anatina TaxID=7574 RepID=A0A1S3HGY2_LINAN|nr:tissue factor pathway inhibitor isoform X1 [Lingula anatina]|eukprot:XP_013385338.1 tissue factor pathway inhibitor isoform X1 [Lingula anatina]
MTATVTLGLVLLIICSAQGKVLPAGCAAVTCFAGQKCVTFPSPKCVTTCQVVKCSSGNKCVETFRGAHCVAVEKLDCSTMDCPTGETCVQDKVMCIKAPCPQPEPRCVPICELPAVPGLCKAYMPSYFFNSKTGQCETFIYGGCGGNANRFKTLEDCQNACLM